LLLSLGKDLVIDLEKLVCDKWGLISAWEISEE